MLVTSEAAPDPRGGTGFDTGASPVFQASGWVEPEPYPVKASALVDGIVAAVHVLEGQDVEKGQVLAALVDEDARLALAAAEGRHRRLLAARDAHLSAIEAMVSKRDASKAEAAAAETMEAEADDQLARFDRLVKSNAVSQLDLISARLRLQREKSLYRAAQAKAEELEAEVRRMDLETKTWGADIALAEVEVDQARLALERTRITAPIAGRVLRLMAAPGDKKMLNMDHPDSSTLCVLYEPGRLQVRVDVPLADAAGLRVGQRARIHTSLLSGKVFDGEVTRIAGEADLQRNTLQAKVRLLEPADQLRPEMLCRVEFLGGGGGGAAATGDRSGGALALWIPLEALQGSTVWVCDPESKRLTRRTVQSGHERRDGHVRITGGLHPGESIVLGAGNWREGQRVQLQPAER